MSPTGWLVDEIINASQKLLKQQFQNLHGLQDVSLGLVLNYEIISSGFLQILNTSHQHWLTISTINTQPPEINVFDSLCNSLPTMAQAQIACIMQTRTDTIEAMMVDVQKQV